MTDIVGAVFLITLASCVFGLIDQTFQAVQRRLKARKGSR